jgi:hypothetical protein
MKRWLAITALCFALGGVVLGQATSNVARAVEHHHVATKTISGMDTPSAIPDLVAYKLWLWAASHADNPSGNVAMIGTVSGMNATDQGAMIPILASFKVQFDALVENYNIQAKAGTEDYAAFKVSLTAIVQQTNATIQSQLSPAGFTQYGQFIQWSKQFMSCAEGATI